MKKWSYFIVVLVVVGILCAGYYFTGLRAEKQFNRFLESSKNFSQVTIKADNYQRGWLRSSVHIDAVVHQPEQTYNQDGVVKVFPAQDISLSFNTNIYHGPIIFAKNNFLFGLGYAEAEIPLPKEVLAQFKQQFTENVAKPMVDVSLLLKYRNRLDVGFDIPSFELTSKDGTVHVNWKGFMSHWQLLNKLAHTKGAIEFNGITFETQTTKGETGPMSLKYDVKNVDGQVLSGDAALNVHSFQLASEGQSPLLIEGFQAVSSNQVNDNLVNSSLKADVSRITCNELDYGPGVLNVSASNLDATALGHIQHQLQMLNNSNLTEAQQQVMWLTLLPELPVLLEHGAEFEVKQFQLSTPLGLILVMAKVKLPVQKPGNRNPLLLLNQIQADASVEMPTEWLDEMTTHFLKFKIQQDQLMQAKKLENANASADMLPKVLSEEEIDVLAHQQTDKQLESLVESGILIKKNNLYRIKVTFKKGAFIVNGKPFNENAIR